MTKTTSANNCTMQTEHYPQTYQDTKKTNKTKQMSNIPFQTIDWTLYQI